MVVDLQRELPALDLTEADEWRFVVMDGDRPRAHVVVPSPGAASKTTLEMTLRRRGDRAREHEVLRERFRERLGAPERPAASLSISVVVPTRRRLDALAALLKSLAALDPAPGEVIVVDNDPGESDCHALVTAAGFRYVREDRRGLNVARRTGLAAATGDVVAFTDDDCLVTRGWLAPLPELFADPLVGVVAGPGLAHELRTGAQLRREEEAGFDKGLTRGRYDWRNTTPPHSGVVGSGNSMAMRRAAALALEPFPPELDAGTRAPAAGDLFAIFRILAAGFDAVYEPRMLFWHRHPATGLRDTIRNYGHGAGAYYTKVLLEERELTAIPLWHWFTRRWVEAVLDAEAGLADRGRVRVRWRYLAASLAGPLAWRRSLADLDEEGRRALAASRAARSAAALAPLPALPAAARAPARPAVSVVVAGGGDVAGLLDADPGDELLLRDEPELADAWNAGAAVAKREILLFLDERARPAPGLIAAHALRHAGAADLIVAGQTALQPADRRLATLAAWRDRATSQRMAREGAAGLAVDLPRANFSARRDLVQRAGGFDGAHPERSFAERTLAAGAQLVQEPAAVALETVAETTRGYLAAGGAPWPVRAPAAIALRALEAARLRRQWAALAALARRGNRGAPGLPMAIDLAATTPIPRPRVVAPRVELTAGTRTIATIAPPGGHWHPLMLDAARRHGPRNLWRAAAHAAAGWPGRTTPPSSLTVAVVLGPAHGEAERAAARALDARVLEPSGVADPVSHWRAIADAVARAETDVVALPLRGVQAGQPWLAELAAALDGPRVAAVVGAGLAPEDPPAALELYARAQQRARYGVAGSPPQFIALRRDLYDAVGGLDPGCACLGWNAPLLDYLERALDNGLVVARLDAHGLVPPGRERPARSVGEWHRMWARGGLHARRALELGGLRGLRSFVFAGLLPLVRVRRPFRVGRKSVRYVGGSVLAFLLGAAAGARSRG